MATTMKTDGTGGGADGPRDRAELGRAAAMPGVAERAARWLELTRDWLAADRAERELARLERMARGLERGVRGAAVELEGETARALAAHCRAVAAGLEAERRAQDDRRGLLNEEQDRLEAQIAQLVRPARVSVGALILLADQMARAAAPTTAGGEEGAGDGQEER